MYIRRYTHVSFILLLYKYTTCISNMLRYINIFFFFWNLFKPLNSIFEKKKPIEIFCFQFILLKNEKWIYYTISYTLNQMTTLLCSVNNPLLLCTSIEKERRTKTLIKILKRDLIKVLCSKMVSHNPQKSSVSYFIFHFSIWTSCNFYFVFYILFYTSFYLLNYMY